MLLLKRGQLGHHCSRRRVWNAKRFSDASNAATISANSNTATDKISSPSHTLFPWRERPLEEHPADVVSMVRDVVSAALIADLSIPPGKYLDDEFLEGAQNAFLKSLKSIFRDTYETNTNHPLEDFIPELYSIFGPNLSNFYAGALSSAKTHFTIKHELISHGLVKISRKDVLFWAQRGYPGNDVSGGLRKKYLMGVIPHLWPVNAKEFSSRYISDISMFDTTLRVSVDIPCTEIFYVKENLTGCILQGSTEPQTVVHQILLEAQIPAGERGWLIQPLHRDNYTWQIVDLDGWMRGDKFWAE